MPGMVKLRVVVGPLLGRVFEFTAPDVFLFGRAPECHARLAEEDVKVSRHHFVLEVRPPRAVLRDLGSLNGTWVNDRKYGGRERQRAPQPDVPKPNPEVEIHAGDKIRVGATVFEVSIEGGSECAACRCGLDLGQSKIYQVMNGRLLCESCARREGTGPVISVRSPLAAEQPSSAVPVPPLEEDFDMSSGAAAAREKRGEDAQLPRAIGNYDIERQVGKGGMGVVYLARRRRDGRAVALKVMSSQMADHDARSVFEREVEVTRALKHAHIVELYEYGRFEQGYYFAMDYCAGGSLLGQMNQRGGPLPLAMAAPLILQALDGLAHAHQKGFIHRDLKPENLLLADTAGRQIKISDFGLAKNFVVAGLSGMTATGDYAGTFSYMPREQITSFRALKPVSDVWSLGATLYFVLTGRHARDFGPDRDPLQVILGTPCVPIRNRDPRIPAAVAAVIDRALADTILERYASAEEFKLALERALQ